MTTAKLTTTINCLKFQNYQKLNLEQCHKEIAITVFITTIRLEIVWEVMFKNLVF